MFSQDGRTWRSELRGGVYRKLRAIWQLANYVPRLLKFAHIWWHLVILLSALRRVWPCARSVWVLYHCCSSAGRLACQSLRLPCTDHSRHYGLGAGLILKLLCRFHLPLIRHLWNYGWEDNDSVPYRGFFDDYRICVTVRAMQYEVTKRLPTYRLKCNGSSVTTERFCKQMKTNTKTLTYYIFQLKYK